MLPVSSTDPGAERTAAQEAVLREVVETLAALDRTPCSAGERRAAEWLAGATRRGPGRARRARGRAVVGDVPAHLHRRSVCSASAAPRSCSRAGAASARCSRRRRFAGIVDEAHNGPRIVRRALRRRRATVNVVARVGPGSRDARRPPRLPATGATRSW